MLDKFNDLHWLARFFVMLVIAAGIWYAFDYFVLTSTKAETVELNQKREELHSSNVQAAIVESRLPEFKAKFEQLKNEYEQTKELLPETVELSRVLESLQVTARNHKLTVVSFSPLDKDGKGDVTRDFYRMKQIGVSLTGNYPNLKSFFQAISELKRVVNISNLTITALNEQREGNTLSANFVLSALYAEKQDVNNLKPLPPSKPDASAPPTAPPAPAATPATSPTASPAASPASSPTPAQP
ncbi:MAG TPA: type 4a pilus biogenesis protein PilO [Blastocatellia bacterium]|nr:type 4a pilus biogenesis protein PilO [Blastocatellia bacterium]